MAEALLREQVVEKLWRSYSKTSEFHKGANKAIPLGHPLIREQERIGLKLIYFRFVSSLESGIDLKSAFNERPIDSWLGEWKGMHQTLFGNILVNSGNWRDIDVRFGETGEEDIYHIPSYHIVPRELSVLCKYLHDMLHQKCNELPEIYHNLADIHYQFIRIHPFKDGNGRIARAITDQLAIYYGLPVAMGGYPRHDLKRRKAYHKAIRSCADDASYIRLSFWIQSYIERQIKIIA